MKAAKLLLFLLAVLFLAGCSFKSPEVIIVYNGDRYISNDEYGVISSLWTITSKEEFEPVLVKKGTSTDNIENYQNSKAYKYMDDKKCNFLVTSTDDSGLIYRKLTAEVPSIFGETQKVAGIEFEMFSNDNSSNMTITDTPKISEFLAVFMAASLDSVNAGDCLEETCIKYVGNVYLYFEDYPAKLFVGKIMQTTDKSFGFSSNLNPNSYYLGKSMNRRWNAVKTNFTFPCTPSAKPLSSF